MLIKKKFMFFALQSVHRRGMHNLFAEASFVHAFSIDFQKVRMDALKFN